MDENLQPSVHQVLERLFTGTRSGGRRGESRELDRVDAGKSSVLTTFDTNISFATLSTTIRTTAEI